MKKVQIHQFDPIIYPTKLWISISNDEKGLSERFVDFKTKNPLDFSLIENHAAITYLVQQKESPTYCGVFIVFTKREYCNMKNIAHESAHAARFIWNYLREFEPSDESDAYLVGWVADCIWKIKTNKY
jgi:hypothetical protein